MYDMSPVRRAQERLYTFLFQLLGKILEHYVRKFPFHIININMYMPKI